MMRWGEVKRGMSLCEVWRELLWHVGRYCEVLWGLRRYCCEIWGMSCWRVWGAVPSRVLLRPPPIITTGNMLDQTTDEIANNNHQCNVCLKFSGDCASIKFSKMCRLIFVTLGVSEDLMLFFVFTLVAVVVLHLYCCSYHNCCCHHKCCWSCFCLRGNAGARVPL